MPRPIAEQVIVITGASSGIGLATARLAAEQGARVVLAARNATDLDRAVSDILRDGGEAIAVPTDVTRLEDVQHLADKTIERFGRIDTWVNNAAVSCYAPFLDMDMQDFRQVLDVVLMGQVHGARAALPHLEKTGGALICVGSILSDRGAPLQTAYSAGKHAIKGWLDGLRLELKHQDSPVRVTLIKPGSMNTPLFSKARTQLGVQPMPTPPIYEPGLTAEAILDAAENDRRDVYVGGMAKAISVMERVSPRLLDLQMKAAGFEGQQTSWPKSASAPSNLYRPVEHDGGTRGEFTHMESRSSPYQYVARSRILTPTTAAVALGIGAILARIGGRTGLSAALGVGALAMAGKALLGALDQE